MFRQKNLTKTGSVPQLDFPDPVFTHGCQMPWPSEGGPQRMAGVTSAETRTDKAKDLFLYFYYGETEACRWEVVCPRVT